MEAGFYGDTGRVIGFFYEVKQCTTWLVPGWVTAALDRRRPSFTLQYLFFMRITFGIIVDISEHYLPGNP